MAFDASQILRQTYASGAEAIKMQEMASARASAIAAPVRGELMGSAVIVESDPLAELQDSMEELSFQFEEKTSKRVAERKLGQMQGSRLAFLRAVEAWNSMMGDMPGAERIEKLIKTIRQMLASGGNLDAAGLLKNLSRESTDPSHQFAMLDIMSEMAGADETQLRDLLREARTQLMTEKGVEVKAGINLAQEINTRATSPAEMQELRDLYRSETIGFKGPQDCWRSLISSRGPGGVREAIDFLISGCGADLASSTPSQDKVELARILTDLGCVESLQTVLEKMTLLVSRMAREFSETCLLNGEELTGKLLDFTEQAFVSSSAFANLALEAGLRQLLAKMDFMREMTRILRQLSPRLFEKEGDRARLVESAQEYLDELIMKEEEEAMA